MCLYSGRANADTCLIVVLGAVPENVIGPGQLAETAEDWELAMSTKPRKDQEDADKSVPASGTPDPDDARTPEERLRGSPDEDSCSDCSVTRG